MDHDGPRGLRPLLVAAALVLLVAAFRAGRGLLIPLAVATLLAFVLSPIVGALHRRGLGQVGSVLAVLVLAVVVLGALSWGIANQLSVLARDLPRYEETAKRKIATLRQATQGTALERGQRALEEVMGEIEKEDRRPAAREQPVPVVVREDNRSLIRRIPALADDLTTAGFVLVLVLFMLLERQELRNRLVRLAGSARLAVTTRALDEAGERIAKFLLTESLINVLEGAVFALGLLAIGVPHALLWGALLGLGRFVPYVGVWVAALFPMALALGLAHRWVEPVLVAGLFVALELLVAVAIEPVVLSQRVGLSKVALLVAIAFWTWLWGPVGLVLGAPMTVCIAVLAKDIPALKFLAVLLTDEPALQPAVGFYQRLLAGDRGEAADVVTAQLEERPVEHVFDEVLVPALALARRDRRDGCLDANDERLVVATTRAIVDDLKPEANAAGGRPVLALGVPVRDDLDAVALDLLAGIVNPERCRLEVLSPALLTSEVLARVERARPHVVCIGALGAGGVSHARYLLKRLRARFPDLKMICGRWGESGVGADDRALIVAAGCDGVGATLVESRDALLALLPVVAGRPAAPAREAGAA